MSDMPAPQIIESSALAEITRGEVDTQVATARRFPRDVARFRREAETLATLDEQTAQECFYVLPRSGKRIEGPSVRLAEIVASAWGNLRCEARIIDEGKEYITAQGTAWDMEKNVLVRTEVRRRITDKRGNRYSEDMRIVAGNAASSIAFRNALFKVIPYAQVKPIYESARKTAIGDSRTLAERREGALGWFEKAGAPRERVLESLGRHGVEALDLDDLITLQGIRTAVMEGSTTIDEAFPEPAEAKAEPTPGVKKVGRKAKPKSKPNEEAKEAPQPASADGTPGSDGQEGLGW